MTFRNTPTCWTKAVIVLAAMVLAGRLFIASEGSAAEEAAIAHVDWDSITFEVLVAVDRTTLIVADGGDYRDEQVYGLGEVPWIDSAPLADGHYRYELRLLAAMNDEDRKALAAAEEAGDEEAAKALAPEVFRHNGNFNVDGGAFLD